ncbi:Uncharacterized protein TCM_045720 [Theobroma cacao]|uniref:Uncharacterized protein n=1 Tax=Theobroma cacao TaxID=3641 RepID=S1RW22_THECC|nr:Uncharacterized protein TCM_045720 [Theobroma cacao]
MSRRGGSPDTPHSASEGSLDSTTSSQWQPEPSSPESADRNKESFESSEKFESESSSDTPKTAKDFLLKQPKEYHREWARKAIARKVSYKECRRIQQAWIEEQRRKSQEEENPEEDLKKDLE